MMADLFKNLLIDGKNMVFRGSVLSSDLLNAKGQPIGVVYSFLRMLRKAVSTINPDRVIIVWDGGKSSWRLSLHPEYKYHNPAKLTPTQKYSLSTTLNQETVLRTEVLSLLPMYQFSMHNTEADDLICAACNVLHSKSEEVIIFSTDHDFYQLLDIATVFNPNTNTYFTKENFVDRYKFEPRNFPIYRALVGDFSDNIKGVSGIGKKTAAKILSNYSNIDSFVKDENANKELRRDRLLNKLGVLETNIGLIDLSCYPEIDKLKNAFLNLLTEDLNSDFLRLRQFLFNNKMFSLYGSFHAWKKPFVKLEKGKN